jgi:hypothetical protein
MCECRVRPARFGPLQTKVKDWDLCLHGSVYQFFFLRTSIRFHPKSRASADHSPGPKSARAIPMVARKMFAQGSPGCVMLFHTPSTATRDPAMGVHKPASSSIPAAVPIAFGMNNCAGCPLHNPISPWPMSELPATNRIMSRPVPGQPVAKVENSRRKGSTLRAEYFVQSGGKSLKSAYN